MLHSDFRDTQDFHQLSYSIADEDGRGIWIRKDRFETGGVALARSTDRSGPGPLVLVPQPWRSQNDVEIQIKWTQ